MRVESKEATNEEKKNYKYTFPQSRELYDKIVQLFILNLYGEYSL